MKTTILALGILVISYLNFHAQTLPAPAEGKAVVYFMRLGVWGSAVKFAHFDNDQFIGKFGGGSYLRYECMPGEHLFWARSQNRDFVPANLEAGQIYFIEDVGAAGMAKAKVKLYPIDPNEIKRIARFVKKINRKPGKQFTPEELKEMDTKREDGIDKGLEKYKEEVAEGKQFRRLEPDMYMGNFHH